METKHTHTLVSNKSICETYGIYTYVFVPHYITFAKICVTYFNVRNVHIANWHALLLLNKRETVKVTTNTRGQNKFLICMTLTSFPPPILTRKFSQTVHLSNFLLIILAWMFHVWYEFLARFRKIPGLFEGKIPGISYVEPRELVK